jgi:hypothetical protein
MSDFIEQLAGSAEPEKNNAAFARAGRFPDRSLGSFLSLYFSLLFQPLCWYNPCKNSFG